MQLVIEENKQHQAEFQIITAILSGVFSFLFRKDFDLKQTNSIWHFGYYGYTVE